MLDPWSDKKKMFVDGEHLPSSCGLLLTFVWTFLSCIPVWISLSSWLWTLGFSDSYINCNIEIQFYTILYNKIEILSLETCLMSRKMNIILSLLYRVSQEESAILREGVPYVKIYRYNPKHICPKLNGYEDNGQRKVWSYVGSMHYTYQLTVCPWLRSTIAVSGISAVFVAPAVQAAMLSECVTYSAWNSKDSYDTVCEFFVVRFNGFMSLTD
jgi:hypothetical protein